MKPILVLDPNRTMELKEILPISGLKIGFETAENILRHPTGDRCVCDDDRVDSDVALDRS